ncbi:cystathionine beta-lyase [Burkholderia sp. SIMBA_024]|nr:cystathionine beta-lyase [Burkholderia ambifaria]
MALTPAERRSQPCDDLYGGMHDDTQLVHAGRDSAAWHGFVNPPVYHASTVLSPTVSDLLNRTQPYIYGRRGTPTTEALEQAITSLEGGAGTVLCPSGLSACTLALLSCLKPGDHLLMTASVYGPVRHACEGVLARLGVETSWYDADTPVAAAFRPNTRAVYVEVPGSYTFDMHDVRALVRLAHAHGALVIADNSWATPLFFRPHALGIDLSIQAGTKYLVGHSDAMLGVVSANERAWSALKQLHGDLGLCVGPDDVYLALRGLRTLGVRLRQHQRNALAVATWLTTRAQVQRVLYPALPGDDGHALWRRDFRGASGLFSIVLQPAPRQAVDAFLDHLTLFGLGYSWGGYESLALPFELDAHRLAQRWPPGSRGVRLHIGLEDADDLIADLAAGLDRYAAFARTGSCEDAARC